MNYVKLGNIYIQSCLTNILNLVFINLLHSTTNLFIKPPEYGKIFNPIPAMGGEESGLALLEIK